MGVRHLGHVCQAFAQRKLSALLGQLGGEGCHLLKSMELTPDFQKFIEFSAWKFFKALEGKCDSFFFRSFPQAKFEIFAKGDVLMEKPGLVEMARMSGVEHSQGTLPNTHA